MRVWRRGVAVVLLGIVAVTVRSAPHLGASGSEGFDGSLSFVPKEAAVCVRVDLEGIAEDAKPLGEIPGLVLEGIGKASGKDLLKEIESKVGLDFEGEIAPALPKEFTVAVSPAEEGETEGAETPARIMFVCRPADLEKAEELMDRFRKWNEKDGDGFSEEEYGDSTIVHQRGMAWTFADGHIVFGTSLGGVEAALDAHKAPEKRLERSGRFQGLRGELRGRPEIVAYVDFFALVEMGTLVPRLPGPKIGVSRGGGAGSGHGFALGLPAMAAEQMEMVKGTLSIVGVDFTGEGVEVANIDQPGEGLRKLMAGLAELPPVDRGLLGRMPAEPLALVAMTSPAQAWGSLREMYRTVPGWAPLLGAVERGLSGVGLDLEQDILGWMKGTTAAGLYYDVKPFPNLVVAWDVVNPEEVKGALAKIREVVSRVTGGKVQFVEEQMEHASVIGVRAAELAGVSFLKPVLALTEKTLYFCSLESALERVLGRGEGSAADAVAEVPNEAQFLGMIDFPGLSKFFYGLAGFGGRESLDGEEGPQYVLEKVGEALGFFGKATGFCHIRSDGSSLERYSLPVKYEALVKFIRELVERIPERRDGEAAASVPRGGREETGPLYAKLGLTKDPSKVLAVAFDRSDRTVEGYDLVYADVNFNGKFEENEQVKAVESGGGDVEEGIFRSFPRINLDVPYDENGEGVRGRCSVVFGYGRYPVAAQGAEPSIQENFYVRVNLRLRRDSVEWEYALAGSIKPAERLESAAVWGFGHAPALEITTKPDLEKKGNLGIALGLVIGDTDIHCTKGGKPPEAHIAIRDQAGEVVHEDTASADKFTFG